MSACAPPAISIEQCSIQGSPSLLLAIVERTRPPFAGPNRLRFGCCASPASPILRPQIADAAVRRQWSRKLSLKSDE